MRGAHQFLGILRNLIPDIPIWFRIHLLLLPRGASFQTLSCFLQPATATATSSAYPGHSPTSPAASATFWALPMEDAASRSQPSAGRMILCVSKRRTRDLRIRETKGWRWL